MLWELIKVSVTVMAACTIAGFSVGCIMMRSICDGWMREDERSR